MNILDRTLAFFAPAAAVKRVAARDMLRSYAAGSAGRLTQGWRPSRAAPDAVASQGRQLLAARSQDLGRNNPWIAAALRRLPAAIVGTGPTASPLGGPGVRKAVADDWAAFCDEGDLAGEQSFGGMLALNLRTVVELGEAFIVWQALPASEGRTVPLGWRLLSPEYLDGLRNGAAIAETPGGVVREGIEFDARGRRVGYWFFDRHPLDFEIGMTRPSSSRYPAEQVDHIFDRLWIGQRRGVPWLAPVAIAADDLGQYETAALWKARMAASLGLIVEAAGNAVGPLGAQSVDAAGRGLEQLAPGAILRLRQGEKASTLTPPTDDNFRTFFQCRMLAIAAGLGLPYASLTGDLSNANYSSLREGKLLFWELLDTWQWLLVHEQILRPAWRRFAKARLAAGRTTGGPLPGVKWNFPKRPWVDPLKDGKALELELALGLTTWPDAVSARGEDAEAQLAEIATWKPKLAEAGIVLTAPAPLDPAFANPAADPAPTAKE